MKISKEYLNNMDYEIVIASANDKKFKICFDGACLCWTMVNYDHNNEFVVNSDDEYLFSYFSCLFEKAKKYESNYDSMINENVFRWKSENDIIADDVSELIIIRDEVDL